jgi:hypothetical protein
MSPSAVSPNTPVTSEPSAPPYTYGEASPATIETLLPAYEPLEMATDTVYTLLDPYTPLRPPPSVESIPHISPRVPTLEATDEDAATISIEYVSSRVSSPETTYEYDATTPNSFYTAQHFRLRDEDLSQPEGRLRFPHHLIGPFETMASFSAPYQEIHPGIFSAEEFKTYWDCPTSQSHFTLCSDISTMIPEPDFRGIMFRVYFFENVITSNIHRGSVFYICGQHSTEVKYMATVTRSMNLDYSLIQLNAYLEDRQFLRPYNIDWPALLILVPTRFNKIPLHRFLIPCQSLLKRIVNLLTPKFLSINRDSSSYYPVN